MLLTSWNRASAANTKYDVDGYDFFVQNAGEAWNLQTTDGNLLRFQVQPGDHWSGDSSLVERSEISATTTFTPGTEIKVSYNFALEPGAANTADWMVVGQFHDATNGGSPPFAIEMNGEKMRVVVRYAQADGSIAYKEIYNDPNNIVRGQTYAMSIDVKFDDNGNGFVNVTRNGVQIASYHGPVGDNDSVYWKEGIYRSDANETITADYSNLSIQSSTTPRVPNTITVGAKLVSDTGSSVSDHVTNDGHVIVSGTTAANASVAIMDGKTQIGTAVADASGSWSATELLGAGTHTLNVVSTDSYGQTASAAVNGNFTVDTSTWIGSTSATLLRDTGASAIDYVTSAGGITLSGTAEVGDSVFIYDNGAQLAKVSASSGKWSFFTTLTEGQNNLTEMAVDFAGNSASANPLLVAVDKTPPSAPAITGLREGANTATTLATNNNILSLHGTSEGNATIQLYNGSLLLASIQADATGAWDVSNQNIKLADGSYKLTVKAMDLAGNVSSASSASLTVDTVAPTLSLASAAISGSKMTLAGDSEAGAIVTVQNLATQALVSATLNSKGAWSTSAASASGVQHMLVTSTDAAGNATHIAVQVAGSGNATLVAAASDMLVGGSGADVFVFTAGRDNGATLLNFAPGQDQLLLAGYNKSQASFTQVDATHWLAADAAHADVITVASSPKFTAASVKFV